MLYAFDLLQHDGADLRDLPLIERKQRLARLLGRAKRQAIQFNEHLTGDGPTVFEHVCRMGLEGIVSKRMDAPYRSGPSKTWLKSKNPASEAVRREREEEWHLTSAHPSPHWVIAVPTLVSTYQTCGHLPVAGNHAFVIIHSPTGVRTSAHAIRGSILTLKGVEGVGFCR